jgi:hypothetical protein
MITYTVLKIRSCLLLIKFYLINFLPSLLGSWRVFRDTCLIPNKCDIVIYIHSYSSLSASLDAWYKFFKKQPSIHVVLSYSLRYRNHGEYLNIIHGAPKNINTIPHFLKRTIVSSGVDFVLNETSLLGRGKVIADGSKSEWYRIGLNGFLANQPSFIERDFPSIGRFETISRRKNIVVRPWCPGDEHILIALQVPNDASLGGINITKWAYELVVSIRGCTEKTVLIRTPQITRPFDEYYMRKIAEMSNVCFQSGSYENLSSTLTSSLFTCTYSSGLGIDSVLHGIPVVVFSQGSFVFELSTSLHDAIEGKYFMPERTSWLEKMSWREFSVDDISSGLAWSVVSKLLHSGNA